MQAIDVYSKLKGRKADIMNRKKLREAAVLLPLVEVEGETHVLFEVRSTNMRSQPGDICFPGGKVDQTDKSHMDSAIRETTEELGVSKAAITNIIPLDMLVSELSGIVYPYVGTLTNFEDIRINEQEVAEVFTVPLAYFLQTEPEYYQIDFKVMPERDFPYELIYNGEDYDWRTRKLNEMFYIYHPKRVIWGLTARIIYHFVELLKASDE